MTDERHLTVELYPKTPEQDLKSMMARLDTIDEMVAEPLGALSRHVSDTE
jgi:hypothetical protein